MRLKSYEKNLKKNINRVGVRVKPRVRLNFFFNFSHRAMREGCALIKVCAVITSNTVCSVLHHRANSMNYLIIYGRKQKL